jgi:hypothetical protein
MDFESMIKDKDANIIRVEEGRLCTSCNNNVQMKVLAISNEVVDDEDKLLYTHDVYFPICGDCYALNMSDVYIHENLKSADDAYRKHFDIVNISEIKSMVGALSMIPSIPIISKLLGFHEGLLTKYMAGQSPTKEHSELMRSIKSLADLEKIVMQREKKTIEEYINTYLGGLQ